MKYQSMISLMLILSPIAVSGQQQQHVVTYYDRYHKMKHEDVYLDAKGQKHGKCVEYYENGSIKESANYFHGELNGKCLKYYHEPTVVGNGIGYAYGLAAVLNYKNGALHGLQQKYYNESDPDQGFTKFVQVEEFCSNDTFKWKKTYDIDDKTGKSYLSIWEKFDGNPDEGPVTTDCYTTSGKIYAHAVRNGKCWRIPYPPQCPNKIEFTCKNGVMDGVYQEWFPNGQLKDSCIYSQGAKDGIEKEYDEDGNLISDVTYLNNKVIEKRKDPRKINWKMQN